MTYKVSEMNRQIFRQYKLKFYLNAQHYIIMNGKMGEVHPHTWELTLGILISAKGFVQYNCFEEVVEERLMHYQNQVLNEIPPFRSILPTLENIVEYFADVFSEDISEVGGTLISISGSESPTRSYVLDLRQENQVAINAIRNNMIDETIDAVLDQMKI